MAQLLQNSVQTGQQRGSLLYEYDLLQEGTHLYNIEQNEKRKKRVAVDIQRVHPLHLLLHAVRSVLEQTAIRQPSNIMYYDGIKSRQTDPPGTNIGTSQ